MDKRISQDIHRYDKGPFITILEKFDFSWTQEEIERAIYQYNHSGTVSNMAAEFRPKLDPESGQIEIALLIIHLGFEGKLEKRKRAFMI